jgi:enamine deaminase RidA (YjgF/YER057c/UK114 family)
MRAQIQQVGGNINAVLEAAGATLAAICKTNTYVTDIDAFFKHVDVRMEYFGALPTSTTVEVRRLAHRLLVVPVVGHREVLRETLNKSLALAEAVL